MSAHDNEVCLDGRGGTQNAVEWIAPEHHWMGADPPYLRHRMHSFAQQSFRLARLHVDQFVWLIVVHYVQDMELRIAGLRQ
jgi:hypothetical protein